MKEYFLENRILVESSGRFWDKTKTVLLEIVEGTDSLVFLHNSQVFKLYDENIDLKTLKLYKDITNQAVEIADGYPTKLAEYEIYWKILPIDEIGGPVKFSTGVLSKQLRYYSKSKLIQGSNLWDFYREDFRNRTKEQDYKCVKKLGGNIEVDRILNSTSWDLNKALGCGGIEIKPINVKPFGFDNRYTFLVTDLCGSLVALSKK